MNSFIRDFSPGLKLLLFVPLFITGAFVGGALGMWVGTMVFHLSPEMMETVFDQPNPAQGEAIRWINNVAQIGTFVFPVWVFILLFGKADTAIRHGKKWSWMMVVFPLWIVLSGSVIDLSAWLNEKIIPAGSQIEAIIKPIEDRATLLTKIILSDTSPWALVSVFLSVAVIPAVSEELLFRGVIQPLLIKATGRIHQAVWITAVLFSFIHFQFYGFLPRVILGAMLGYSLVWSGSLWTPIIAHFFNNAMAVIFFHFNGGSLDSGENTFQDSLPAYLFSLIAFSLLGIWLWKKRDRTHEQKFNT